MTYDQAAVLAITLGMLILFAWGRWRHDVVAIIALLTGIAVGVVPAGGAFDGFANPAVISVAMILVTSRGLSDSGAASYLVGRLGTAVVDPTALVLALSLLAAALSSVMNNVGALALLLPAALRVAKRANISPAILLMPMSFASMLGGMTTLIGTPPNLIVSAFRARVTGEAFQMFDFAPVGLIVAALGLVFLALIGWRLIPASRRSSKTTEELLDVGPYFSELRVPPESKAAGMTVREVEQTLSGVDILIVGIAQGARQDLAPSLWRVVASDDVLLVEAGAEAIKQAVSALGLALAGAQPLAIDRLRSKDIDVMELVVLPTSPLIGRTARDLRFRSRFSVNLLAVSRQGRHSRQRLGLHRFESGDVLLLQGERNNIADLASGFACVPLAERSLAIDRPRQPFEAVGLLLLAVAATALGFVPVQIAFAAVALAYVLRGLVPLRRLYDSVDWSVIVLLGALIPVAGAIESTGLASLAATALTSTFSNGAAIGSLLVILVVTMALSDVINNAATALVMAPIAVEAASRLGVSPDPFLMAVAIGASCAFLTPIGHQNNTLILGPGGYRFGDYWRVGLPLEIVIVVVALPLLLWIWPL